MDDPLTREMIEPSRVIAKGRKIRDVSRLVREYGGNASRWTKKSSPPFQRGDKLCEYHWYEHQGIGRVEIKLKMIGSA